MVDFITNRVGYWTFAEATGTNVADQSGNGHDATLVGDTLDNMTAVGRIGNAVDFDGKLGLAQRINAPIHSDFVLGAGDWSIGVRLKADSLKQTGWAPTAVGKGDTSTGEFMIRSSTTDGIEFTNIGGATNRISGLSAGLWYDLIWTYDGSELLGYLNGALVVTTVTSSVNISTTKKLQFGIGDDIATRGWDGLIDEVSVWKGRALSAADAAAWAAWRGVTHTGNVFRRLAAA